MALLQRLGRGVVTLSQMRHPPKYGIGKLKIIRSGFLRHVGGAGAPRDMAVDDDSARIRGPPSGDAG